MRPRLQRLHAVVALAALIAVGAACSRPPAGGTGNGRPPVIFVHGFGLSGAAWSGVMSRFQARGYAPGQLSAITYQSVAPIETSAQVLEAEVDRVMAATGATKVDIVSHSMGSMVAKTCIIIGRCKGHTAHWESMAGVDNGANQLAIATGLPSDDDVQGRTPLRQRLQDGWQEGIFDQGVKVQVHWSPNDQLAANGVSQEPPPAVNISKPNLNHLTLMTDPTVISETITFFGT